MIRSWSAHRARLVLFLWLGLSLLGAWFHAFPAGLVGGAIGLALVILPTASLLWVGLDQLAEPARWLPAGETVRGRTDGQRDLRVSLLAHWVEEAADAGRRSSRAADPLRGAIRELAEDRLWRRHAVTLEDAAARELLGPAAYAYVTTRDPLPARQARSTLSEILTRIEAL